MHLLPRDIHGLDDAAAAVDLAQTPADIVFLSFSDSELCLLARLHEQGDFVSLRCAQLAQLKHPYSVDLYIETVARHAKLVVVRLLGGKDYWPYGVEQLESAARTHGFALAIVPGDVVEDARLARASTLDDEALRRIRSFFDHGGPDNLRHLLACLSTLAGAPRPFAESVALPGAGVVADLRRSAGLEAPRAAIVFYRSMFLSSDIDPLAALADALSSRGVAVGAAYVVSLKDPESAAFVADWLQAFRPDVVVNATAFSARGDAGGALDVADAPVLQVALATSSRAAWTQSARGANGADLAMNVVLPEVDGRIFTRAISFKEPAPAPLACEFAPVRHAPDASRIDFVADLAVNWAKLRRKANAEKRLALVLSDYPTRRGRGGYAIGLDTEKSVFAIVAALGSAGYDVDADALGAAPMRALEDGAGSCALSLGDYDACFSALPEAFRASVMEAWGAPQDDPAFVDGAFRFSCIESGRLAIALQPDRGARSERRESYHDMQRAPRHAYVAFYLWLRGDKAIDALIHLGAHGTLEWLPGKAVMLSQDCAPEALLGPTPLIYPFIVNDPGEAAQAKRRTAAVTLGHMTPPLVEAGLYDAAAEIETLLDEYANAATLDPRRAKHIAGAILDAATRNGLVAECGADGLDVDASLTRLDAWLCDVKQLRVGDGLHVYGEAGEEMPALRRALAGRFIEPGPAGAPSRGRADVVPTGRNLFCIDPRHVPTRTAFDIGLRAAQEVMTRHAQQHGDWPRSVMLDLWGSASIRTGGEEIAQALALIGAAPLWDNASARVVGFEIEPAAKRAFPRVDVTLHVSGLFRDMFPNLIALFDDAARAVAALDEDEDFNPLVATRDAQRIFGAAQGAYGLGVVEKVSRGEWTNRADLGAAFLDAAGHAYGRDGDSAPARAAFAQRVAGADALVHVQDMADVDVLTGAAFADYEGGFAAANQLLGGAADILHVDATAPERLRARSLKEEVARVVRGRVANPRWLAGQMRHGHRGGAEIAEAIDNLFAFAATSGVVDDAQFDLVFDATLGDETLRSFLLDKNPRAAQAMAQTFRQAMARDLWQTRRNSVGVALALVEERHDFTA